MKNWILECSIDADAIDYEEIIQSETEPDFWTCYYIAQKHGCPWFTVSELTDYEAQEADRV